MKRMLGYTKRYGMWIVWIMLFGLGCSVANVYIVDLVKQMIDLSISKEPAFSLWMLAVRTIAAILIGMLSNGLVVRTTGNFGAAVLRDMRHDLVNHIMKVAPNDMEKQNFGDIMERLSSDVANIAGYMETYFKDCLYVPIVVIVFTVYLVSMNPMLAVLCLGPLLVMVPVSVRLLKPVKIAQAEYVKRLGFTNNHIQEAFDGADVIKAYNLQEKMQAKYYNALKETWDISNKNDLWQYNIEPLSALIREAPTAIALCVGGYLALKGELSIGILVAFISGIKKINEPLVYAYQLVIRTQMAMISVNRVLEILDMPVECSEGAETYPKEIRTFPKEIRTYLLEKTQELKKFPAKVFEFKNVFFSYAGSENAKPVLEQFYLSVYEGQKLALVGKSGCGKSTVMKLMCRQNEVDAGEICFYGNTFSDINPNDVRDWLSFLAQEAVIFPMSVLDNIRIGRPDAGREEIIDAAQKAGCHDFIMELAEGYDTLLEERGNNLSGGQRQRIAIARAILKDAPIILLDEPTSALDAETEKYVNETLLAISANKTLITVAHRLSTIVDYDEIVVLEEGKIVESGTHAKLMEKKGNYWRMYNEYIMSGGVS